MKRWVNEIAFSILLIVLIGMLSYTFISFDILGKIEIGLIWLFEAIFSEELFKILLFLFLISLSSNAILQFFVRIYYDLKRRVRPRKR